MSNGINTIQAANNGITSITKLVQSAQSLVSQAQQTNDTATQATLVHAVRRPVDPDRPARWRLGLQRHQPAWRRHPDRDAERIGQLDHHRHWRQLHQRQRGAAEHRQRGQQLGGRRGHHCGIDRSDRRAHLVAVGVADPQRQFVDRADPSGFHQGDDQHAAVRFCRPHAGRLATRKAPTCLRCRPASSCRTTALSLASQADQNVLRLFR